MLRIGGEETQVITDIVEQVIEIKRVTLTWQETPMPQRKKEMKKVVPREKKGNHEEVTEDFVEDEVVLLQGTIGVDVVEEEGHEVKVKEMLGRQTKKMKELVVQQLSKNLVTVKILHVHAEEDEVVAVEEVADLHADFTEEEAHVAVVEIDKPQLPVESKRAMTPKEKKRKNPVRTRIITRVNYSLNKHDIPVHHIYT